MYLCLSGWRKAKRRAWEDSGLKPRKEREKETRKPSREARLLSRSSIPEQAFISIASYPGLSNKLFAKGAASACVRLRLDSSSSSASSRSRGFCGLCRSCSWQRTYVSTRNSVRNRLEIPTAGEIHVSRRRAVSRWWKAAVDVSLATTGGGEKRKKKKKKEFRRCSLHLKNHDFLQVRATCSKGVSLAPFLPLRRLSMGEIGSKTGTSDRVPFLLD